MKIDWVTIKNRIPWPIVISFLVGAVFGLVVLGWGLWPVEYVDADISALRERHQIAYVQMVADSFALTGDLNQAKARLAELENKDRSAEDVAALVAEVAVLPGNPDQSGRAKTLAAALAPQAAPTVAQPIAGQPTVAPTAPAKPEDKPARSNLLRLCLIPIFVLLIVAGAALIISWLRRRGGSAPVARIPRRRVVPSELDAETDEDEVAELEEAEAEPAERQSWPAETIPWDGDEASLALGHFVTTFELGDDGYDESFGIETETGEFLGECGVAISEVIGAGTEKPCAFDVWLFDKSDIRTVTTVVASPYAYEDDTLRTKLGAKGNLVLAEKGQPIVIETAALRVRAEIVDLAYGGGDLPAESYFTKFTLELSPSRKRPE